MMPLICFMAFLTVKCVVRFLSNLPPLPALRENAVIPDMDSVAIVSLARMLWLVLVLSIIPDNPILWSLPIMQLIRDGPIVP
jgi:hypothetical protein